MMDTGERPPSEEALAAHIGITTSVTTPEATSPSYERVSAATGAQLDRFSQKTRQILASAAEQARQLGHAEIRPEHLLLALLLEQDNGVTRPLRTVLLASSGGQLLSSLREVLVERLKSIEVAGLPGAAKPATLSEGCKQVLQSALAEASRLDSPEVSPAHLFFGLVKEGSALDGSEVVTLLALRGLRNALGSRAWRTAGPGIIPGSASGYAEHSYRVAPGQPGPTSAATRDNVITFRVTDAELGAIDALVESGAMRSRSEASSWLLHAGIDAKQDFFDQIRAIGEEIARLRQEVQRLTEAHIGRAAASQEEAGANPEERAGEPPRSEQSA